MNSAAYPLQSKRLLDQAREILRYKHYSLKTKQAYLFWIRFCAMAWAWWAIEALTDMVRAEVTQFLTMLANSCDACRSPALATSNWRHHRGP